MAKRAKKLSRAEKVAEAGRLRKAGVSIAEVARLLKISDGCVRNYERESKRLATVEEIPDEPTPAPTRAALPSNATALERAKRMQDKLLAQADAAEADGNHNAVAKLLRDAGAQGNIVARLEKAEKGDADTVVFSRAELKRAVQTAVEKITALCNVPLMCPACGRAMRIAAVTGEEPPKT